MSMQDEFPTAAAASSPRDLQRGAPPAARPGDPFADDPRWEIEDERGELRPAEFAYRGGLLLGSALFFFEGLGAPWERNLFGVAALLLSLLITTTLLIQWRVLGDWRRWTVQVLDAGLAVVLTFPIAAALRPELGASFLPDSIEGAVLGFLAEMRGIPGATIVLQVLQNLLAFLFLLLTLVILALGSIGGRRGGIILVGVMMALICLFFYPSAETVAGFLFLGLFLASHWETPLLIPVKVRAMLRPIQREYLRQLLRSGSLSPGETKLYLDQEPQYFAELVDFQLVHYDPIAREILPGPRLLHDPGSAALETFFSGVRRSVWILVGLLYVILPDMIPGPIDDVIILAICTGAGTRLFDMLRPARKR